MAGLTTNESIGTSARINVARISSCRLGAVVPEDNLDPDLDGTYGWKRADGEPRLGRPVVNADYTGWSVVLGDD